MLQKLFIQNYAIIDEVEIDFTSGLNVITGETGAGKSIIAGALGLILGDRADTGVLVNKEKKCIVEGYFAAEKKKAVSHFLKQNELDNAEELVIRREIAVNGKSRAFINDTPVNLSQLNELGTLLVDLHQQFDTLALGSSDFQMAVIDALAGNESLLEDYQDKFYEWANLRKETAALKEQQSQFEKEADYNRFQFNELEEAGFKVNELEETEAEVKLLNNAEGIRNALERSWYALQDGEQPVVQQLKILINQLNPFSSAHPGITPLVERLQSAQVELQDIAGELSHLSTKMNADPAKMEELNERLSEGYRLLKKHSVQTTAELLQIQQQLEEKLKAVSDIGDLISQKEKDLQQLHEQLSVLAKKLTTARKKEIKPLEEKLKKLLTQVGMPNAVLKVEITGLSDYNDEGLDKVSFLFDANKSGLFQSINKVASGGELSRLMLCIKSLIAQTVDLATMVFDEIDSGISGEAARQVGIILKGLAAKRQIICISHQPQIAGKANTHFFVYKEIVNDKVKTGIRALDTEERITSIARMLSGEKITAAAIANAKEMMN